MIIDEAKHFFRLDRRLHRIINGSYIRETAKTHIQLGGRVREYRTFAPKVLSLIGELPPDTASRTVRINLIRKPSEVAVAEIWDSPSAQWAQLRSKILRWTRDNEFSPPPVQVGSNYDRLNDNWKALLSVAAAGGWMEKGWQAYQALSESLVEDDPASTLLIRIKEIFEQRNNPEFLTSKTLVTELNSDPSASWYRISEQKLAQFLRAFRIRPEQHRRGHRGTAGGGRGYWLWLLRTRAFTHI